LAESLRATLADIIRTEMRDPRLVAGLLSITSVDVTTDLKYATVYFSFMGDDEAKAAVMKALRGAAGLLRAELGRTKAFKSVPELQFRYDDSIERGAKVFELIQEANRQTAAMPPQEDDEPDATKPAE
jgi:ribosome-binding factor A